MKLSGEYTIGFGTDKNNPARYTVAEDAKIFKIDTDGVITAVSLKSITTDENDTVLYTLDDGQITNLFVQEVNAKNEDKVNGEWTAMLATWMFPPAWALPTSSTASTETAECVTS